MTSTYSPNLRLELMANGDQSGTWGATTNTNLGTLIEQAIAGYANISPGASSYALTVNNGALDEARSAIVNNATTFGAATYLPPVPHQFIFSNRNANTKQLYCSTVAGNTTAAGKSLRVIGVNNVHAFTDGTDVFNAVSMVDGVPAMTVTSNGNPARVTGGVGGATSGTGGAVAINGGSGLVGGGGFVAITGGAGSSGVGGAILITGGATTTGVGLTGSQVSITGGAGSSDATTNGPGGVVTITGGASGGGLGTTALGGDIQLTPGTGGAGIGRVDFTNASVANGTSTVSITALGPGTGTATISGWLSVKVNGTQSYIPYWR